MGMERQPSVPGCSVMQAGGGAADLSHIYSFEFYLNNPTTPVTLIFANVRVFTAATSALISYTGIVDQYGQFTKEEWPGKVVFDGDIVAQAQIEAKEPFPDRSSQDQYGGSLALPGVKSTGFFGTTLDSSGRWWLVTPLGHLFFSIGMDGVPYLTTATYKGTYATDVQGREQVFASLPSPGDPLAAFDTPAGGYPPPAGSATQFTLGTGFDFYTANLWRKYGSNYTPAWMQSTIDRFTRWGINDIASSAPVIDSATGSLGQKIPHTATLSYASCTGCGNFAHVVTPYDDWGAMVDPFDPAFAQAADALFAQQTVPYVTDPYLIGYFVDSELSWAGDVNATSDNSRYSLVYGVLNSGASQPAKQAFAQMLTTEYTSIGNLNQAWQTSFTSWSQLLSTAYAAPVPLPSAGMRSDFSALLLSFAQQYFRVINSTIKKHDPNHLYLGPKFDTYTLEEVQACAQFCDAISFDNYESRIDPAEWAFLHPFGKPAIVAEFHFGATDRGGFFGGAVGSAGVASQAARALSYGLKMQDAMTNPDFLGAHWFEYVDEPITGTMSGGENVAIGFVSLTDTPYPELTTFASSVNRMVNAWRTAALPSSPSSSPVPVLSTIAPTSATAGGSDFLLTVSGSNFAANSIVQWNGSACQTLVASSSQIWALVPALDIGAAGAAQVTVSTPAPGGGASGALTFSIRPPMSKRP